MQEEDDIVAPSSFFSFRAMNNPEQPDLKMNIWGLLRNVDFTYPNGTPDDVYRQGGLYKEIFDASARSMNADKIADTLQGT